GAKFCSSWVCLSIIVKGTCKNKQNNKLLNWHNPPPFVPIILPFTRFKPSLYFPYFSALPTSCQKENTSLGLMIIRSIVLLASFKLWTLLIWYLMSNPLDLLTIKDFVLNTLCSSSSVSFSLAYLFPSKYIPA